MLNLIVKMKQNNHLQTVANQKSVELPQNQTNYTRKYVRDVADLYWSQSEHFHRHQIPLSTIH